MAEGHFCFGFLLLKRLVRENVYVDKYIKLNYFTTFQSQKAAPLTFNYNILSMQVYIIMLLVLPFKSWFYRQDIYFLKGLFRYPFSTGNDGLI